MTDDRINALITAAVADEGGLTVVEWRADDEYDPPRPRAYLGRYAATDDDEDEGVFVGDAGDLYAEVVGGAEYGNERVAFYLLPDGMDASVEVRPDAVERAT